MKRGDKLILIGVLLSGALALFAKSAGASSATSAPANGLAWDPGFGLPRVQTQTRLTVSSLAFPVNVYEWGQASAPNARLIVASDDPSSWVGFVPPTGGDVQTILAHGPGPMTPAILAFLQQTTVKA